MKKEFYLLLFLGIILFSVSGSSQKTVVVVNPDEGVNIGALNKAIKSAADPGNTIFELKRGGLYLLNGTITNSGYTLHIRAQEGNGIRPILQPAVDELGASAYPFTPGGSVILDGLYIQDKNEIGAIVRHAMVVSNPGCRIVINNCIMDNSGQSFVRLTSIGNSVFITNSILRNSLLPTDPANGRIIDTRSNPQDTLLIENSTIYNCGSEIIRMEGGATNLEVFNHNTVFQANFKLNFILSVVLKAKITNNLFYNFAYRADNSQHEPLFVADSMFSYGNYTDADRRFDLSNNNWYTQKEIADILDEYGIDTLYRFAVTDIEHKDTIKFKWVLRNDLFANRSLLGSVGIKPPVLMNFISAGQVDTTDIIRESLKFINPPALNLDYWKFYVEHNFAIGGTNPPIPFAYEDINAVGEVETGAFDFRYNKNSMSATGADNGLPLGDPRWEPYSTVSSIDLKSNEADKIKAYPNPAGEIVTFEIESSESSSVAITIFDMLGKVVIIQNDVITKGKTLMNINLGAIQNSGIYLYQIQTKSSTGNIISIKSGKIIKN